MDSTIFNHAAVRTRSILLFSLLLSGTAAFSASLAYTLNGLVSDASGLPVQGASVKIENTACTATTGSDGKFTLVCSPTGARTTLLSPGGTELRLIKRGLAVSLRSPSPARIDLFDLGGRRIATLVNGTLRAGMTRVSLPPVMSPNICLLYCRIGNVVIRYKMAAGGQLLGGTAAFNENLLAASRTNASASAIGGNSMVTVEIHHPSYATQKIAVSPAVDTVVPVWLVKAEANWVAGLGQPCVDQDAYVKGLSNGNYFVLGTTHSLAGDYNIGVVVLDPRGSFLAYKQYGSDSSEFAYRFGVNEHDDIRVFATYGTSPYSAGFMALHLSPSGDSLGTRIFLTDQGLTPNGGIVLSDGGYLISGATSAIDSMGRSLGSAELVRFSPADSLLWQQRYSFGNYTNGYELISLRQGGYVLSGWYLDTVSYDLKMFLNRLDESGNAPKPLLFSQLEGAFFHQIIETADNKLFVIGHVTRSDKEYPYMARVSHDCELEWDTVIIDTTDIRRISCMTSFADSTLLLACIAVPERSPTALFDWERLKLVNIAGSGKVLRERVISEECGHPESISIGKDGSIVITTALGYTFDQQRYYVVNVTW